MPAASSEDGSLNVHVSRDRTQADASMMTFVKQHMGEILRPFAEHVDHLHNRADLLSQGLEETERKLCDVVEMNSSQNKLIQGLRDDLTVTQRQAAATNADLNKTAAEGVILRADFDETKLDVARIQKTLMDTIAHVDQLQRSHDIANKALAKVSSALQETREHIKNRIEVQMEHQGKELRNVDAAQEATAQLLAATKRFADEFHEEFNTSLQRQESLNTANENRFDRIDNRLGHSSTMLTETINRLNTHANHLRTTNGAVRPIGEKLDTLAGNHHKLRLQVKEVSDYLSTLQQNFNGSEERLRQLDGQLGDAEMSKQALGADLAGSLEKLSAGLNSVKETLKHHQSDVFPGQNKRMVRLEMCNTRLLQEVKHMHEQIGSQVSQPLADVMVEADLPPMPKVTQKVTPGPPLAGAAGPSLAGAAGALMGVGMRARLDKCNRKLEDHDHDIATTTQKLQEAHDDLKMKTKRIENLEKKLESLGKSVSETKDGLELTEEWWKGLSHGFRETHRQISIDKDLLPLSRPGTAFSMASTQSGGPSRSHSRPQSARAEARDGRLQLTSSRAAAH
mmetsp:Transcript_9309/g.17808  ORF Transcript_9309/g.17808 Transcript_9309/m.17808 type:complete len:567 (+) Transcript_9309:48-1748(+)|eukprot:CAMPEP_0172832762 /NCGR_PEP_ID=MMETSP1075-20121228/23888_1 /TAXON_ID=2916 /ORGANISM="Ceratium fusus, Strain PA161109" /LENGTH=566 /DNA_ID=CAMNT_0013675415 /DNA_START=46 /DNA_END=1746 /DNA_ORIENTATION=-